MNLPLSTATLLVLSFALVGTACAPAQEDASERIASTTDALEASCESAVIVLRHAEDMDTSPEVGEKCKAGDQSLPIPGGVQAIHQSCLTDPGKAHAKLYQAQLATEVSKAGLCPIARVITQDPWTVKADGNWPSANPFETIQPFAYADGEVENQVPIEFWPPSTKFDLARREALRPAAGTSVLVAWDREGLAGSSGVLASMKKPEAAQATSPLRDSFYVFTTPNEQAQFDLTEYRQFFQDSSNYFSSISGKTEPSRYYRFFDGNLRSKTKYSPDLVPSAMIVCKGTSCGDNTVSLSEGLRK